MELVIKKQSNRYLVVVAIATLLTVMVSILAYTANQRVANAAPVSGFNAGNIIDDAVFTNHSSMNAAQIQGFLNSKMPACDTWHAAGFGQNPPFTCLKDYNENGKSAAQIIYDTAQQYRINPQVFIVLLQKEQGLVTDTWPLDKQYRTATGYGCPDTAPCDSQYYGLTNQLQWSGKMFRAIVNASPTWYTPYILGPNFVQYSPNSACGGSNINIENRATQALYNYTPYQPNQGALNAGWGTADCGAYGNRNFYLYFTQWFGSVRYTFGATPSFASIYARTACKIDIPTDYVGRLYNPDSRDFLYTTSPVEACVAVSYGYIWDGTPLKSVSESNPDAIPVYRLANNVRHVYTTSTSVKNDLMANSAFKDEGISFYLYGNNDAGRTPVYGLQLSDTFFITSSGREAVYYQDVYSYYNFGIIAYTEALNTSTTPVFRLSRNNSRLYTPSLIERDQAISRYGFVDEGVVSTNDTAPNTDNTPIYRLRSPSGAYFYTKDRIERDAAIINHGYHSEGVGFHSLLWSNSPVYRSTNYNIGLKIFTNSQLEHDLSSERYGYSREGNGWFSY